MYNEYIMLFGVAQKQIYYDHCLDALEGLNLYSCERMGL